MINTSYLRDVSIINYGSVIGPCLNKNISHFSDFFLDKIDFNLDKIESAWSVEENHMV